MTISYKANKTGSQNRIEGSSSETIISCSTLKLDIDRILNFVLVMGMFGISGICSQINLIISTACKPDFPNFLFLQTSIIQDINSVKQLLVIMDDICSDAIFLMMSKDSKTIRSIL